MPLVGGGGGRKVTPGVSAFRNNEEISRLGHAYLSIHLFKMAEQYIAPVFISMREE